MSKSPPLPKDRKGRQIEEGDYVAFDFMICLADNENDEMWDILWGVARKHGIDVLVDPLTGMENQIYNYSEEEKDMLIIKKESVKIEDLNKKFKNKSAEEMLIQGAEVKTAEELGMTQEEIEEFMELDRKAREAREAENNE